ncbi:hypothetical protein ACFOON_12405 [Novosphingobium piscinae]|uniref:Uncharacterized protein n=1 Tax=Novosphingobium piscinae TaxID=1507448 RepID=A0A7X1FX81_9SPHN|nr:hypothetical protein [Novosphingobium piscinae]MBC2667982.1 hypothetical protein [Novosphingobium piscinae]
MLPAPFAWEMHVAGASADGEVNHWPAFVDVLTTVIMVVTFLLVIMSAAVMQLSQRVIQNFKQQIIAEQQRKAQGASGGKITAGASEGQQNNRLQSPAEAESGTSVSELGAILKSETVTNGVDRLTIRTRDTKDTLALQIKAVEQPDASKGVEVKTADTLLKIGFAPTATTYDDENSGKVIGFLRGKVTPGTKYEIWAFTPQTRSVTEAQRLGFYRAAMTRNLLIKAGIAPADILTQVRVTDPKAADGHMVRVVIKP